MGLPPVEGKERNRGSRIEQREKLDFDSVSMKTSTDPIGRLEAEIALQNWGKGPARPLYSCMHQALDLD